MLGNNGDVRSTLFTLVAADRGADRADHLAELLDVHPDLDGVHDPAPRRIIAQAVCVALLDDLVDRVPSAAEYLADPDRHGRRLHLDHGAVRTVAWPHAGALPPGEEQVSRVLRPLGYEHRETYPLPSLRMTGRSYAHVDLPAHVCQWFVSELHPDEFSPAFQSAVGLVLASSRDPIDAATRRRLDALGDDECLPVRDAVELVPALVACFRRHHDEPVDSDYDVLLAESAEMAWIATEGTAFNHATDRVPDVVATAEHERAAGRPIKDTVEVSRSRRVRQTAHRAPLVTRRFRTREGARVEREVPGSFFEFISRDLLPDGSAIDLGFDAANATGIFAMTRVTAPGAQRE